MEHKVSKEFKEFLNKAAMAASRIPTWVFAKTGKITFNKRHKWREDAIGREYKGEKKH